MTLTSLASRQVQDFEQKVFNTGNIFRIEWKYCHNTSSTEACFFGIFERVKISGGLP